MFPLESSLHGNPEVGVGPDGEEPLNHYVVLYPSPTYACADFKLNLQAPSEEAEELALREEIRSQFTLMNTMTKDMIHAKRAGGTDLRSGLSAILREVTSLTARWGILEQRELPGNVRHTRDLIRPFFHAKLGELLGMCVELQARIEADKTTDPLSRMDLNQIIAKLRAVPDFKADERSEHVIVHM
ncbi:hypothetical protein H0H93_003944 [Arthromyces matolae]|nr:hypothetical protein H0H93_003944 [Arthromyces matolae]